VTRTSVIASWLLTLQTLAAHVSYGQRLRGEPLRWQQLVTFPRASSEDILGRNGLRPAAMRFGNPSDHRWEGVAVGVAALGVGMSIVGHQVCTNSRESVSESCAGTTVTFGLLGAVVGAVVGGIIGGGIPKQ